MRAVNAGSVVHKVATASRFLSLATLYSECCRVSGQGHAREPVCWPWRCELRAKAGRSVGTMNCTRSSNSGRTSVWVGGTNMAVTGESPPISELADDSLRSRTALNGAPTDLVVGLEALLVGGQD